MAERAVFKAALSGVKGMVRDRAPHELRPGELYELRNGVVSDGAIRRRGGIRAFSASTPMILAIGANNYRGMGDCIHIATAGGNPLARVGEGTITAVYLPFGAVAAGNPAERPHFINHFDLSVVNFPRADTIAIAGASSESTGTTRDTVSTSGFPPDGKLYIGSGQGSLTSRIGQTITVKETRTMTGKVAVARGETVVYGFGTTFTKDLVAGQPIQINYGSPDTATTPLEVASVESDTVLYLTETSKRTKGYRRLGTSSVATQPSSGTPNVIVGTGTNFTSVFSPGDHIIVIGDEGPKAYPISAVTDNTHLTVSSGYTPAFDEAGKDWGRLEDCLQVESSRTFVDVITGVNGDVVTCSTPVPYVFYDAIATIEPTILVGIAQKPAVIESHSGRLFRARFDGQPDRFEWTQGPLETRFSNRSHYAGALAHISGLLSQDDRDSGYLNYASLGSGEPIIAMCSVGFGLMLIFTPSQCWRLTGVPETVNATNPSNGLTLEPYEPIGCLSLSSVEKTPHGLIFANRDDIYLWNAGEGFQSLTEGRIQTLWRSLASGDSFEIYGSAFFDGDSYEISTNAGTLRCHIPTRAWSWDDGFDMFDSVALASNRSKVYCAGAWGFGARVYRIDGITRPTTENLQDGWTAAYVPLTAISGVWAPGGRTTIKFFNEVKAEVERAPETANPKPQLSYALTMTPGSASWTSLGDLDTGLSTRRLRKRGKGICFKVSGGNPNYTLSVNDLEVSCTPMRTPRVR